MYEWIIQNKELLKIFYALIIALICFIIVLRTDKLFRLSHHQGIRYFRNAFFFYGLAFIFRYLAELIFRGSYSYLKSALFEYFLIMAGFFLLYSLIWKKFESSDNPSLSSLFNPRILLFYLMALVVVIIDFVWLTHTFMFLSQVISFFLASVISYSNYQQNSKKGKFLKFYFLAMFLTFIVWILNFLAAILFSWDQVVLISIYILNLIIFFLFLFGVIKFTNRNG